MSVGISICFLAGRYHATPWDHQVNEGVVEWPPSPWRILRALIAAYYRLPNPPERERLRGLVTQLAEEAPSYSLPQATTAHTRHYMPIRKESKNTTTRVIDTFLVLEGGVQSPAQLQVHWPSVELAEAEQALLQQLCQQVSYIGRAESWAELSVCDAPVRQNQFLAFPMDEEPTPEAEARLAANRVEVLVPLDAAAFERFRANLDVLPKPKRGKAKWTAPADILEALEVNIGDLHRQGWNGIPGSRWVSYALQSVPSEGRRRGSLTPLPQPNFARYAITSNVLPKLTQALSVGDRFHRSLTSRSKGKSERPEPVFSGMDAQKRPMQGHQHAFFLPEDVDGDGKIDHLCVYAPMGFSPQAISALSGLRHVWSQDSLDLQTVLIALGQVDDYRKVGLAALGPARVWKSVTPLVLTRHPKVNKRGEPKLDPITQRPIDGPEDQVHRMLQQLGYDCPVTVEPLKGVGKLSGFYYSQFQLHRREGGGRRGQNRGYGFRLRFEEAQNGPIALGYGSHFGLGMFVPDEGDACADG